MNTSIHEVISFYLRYKTHHLSINGCRGQLLPRDSFRLHFTELIWLSFYDFWILLINVVANSIVELIILHSHLYIQLVFHFRILDSSKNLKLWKIVCLLDRAELHDGLLNHNLLRNPIHLALVSNLHCFEDLFLIKPWLLMLIERPKPAWSR